MSGVKAKLHLILALIVILWINSGLFSYISVHLPDVIKIAIFFGWLIIACIKRINFFVTYIWRSKFLIIFFLILIIASNFAGVADLSYYIKTTMFLMMIYSILLYYYDSKYCAEKKFILNILIIDYIYIAINTIIKLQKNPGLSRYLSMSEENIVKILGVGSDSFLAVGNYTFAYSMVFIGLFCAYKAIYNRNNRFIFIYIAILFLIIKMQFTMSILILLVFTAIMVFVKVNKNRGLLIINICAILVISIVLQFYLPSLLMSLSTFMPHRVEAKLIQLSHLLSRESIEGTDLNERLGAYVKSTNCFLNNIFIGALSGNGKIGGHSTWFDFLAQFGLISLPIFNFFIETYKKIIKQLSKVSSIYIRISFLYILFLGFVNTIYSPRLLLALFIFAPFIASIYGGNGLCEEESVK